MEDATKKRKIQGSADIRDGYEKSIQKLVDQSIYGQF